MHHDIILPPLFLMIRSGIGATVDLDLGLFHSWHHSLFSSMYNRLKRSEMRTLDPNEAKVFIIPYDISLDKRLSADCGPKRGCTDNMLYIVENIFKTSKYFLRHQGNDHLVITSLGGPTDERCYQFSSLCKNCIFTAYFTYPSATPHHTYSFPFPSFFHHNINTNTLPWDIANRNQRKYKVSYIGGIVVMVSTHTKIRRKLVQECEKNPSICHLMSLTRPDTNTKPTNHTNIDNSDTTTIPPGIQEDLAQTSILATTKSIMAVYASSVFCLCPPGDDPTRKGLIDIIVSGCIPVLFHPMTLYHQYPLHLSLDIAVAMSVYIPMDLLIYNWKKKKSVVDVMQYLNSINDTVIKHKQQIISQIAPKLQYSIPDVKYLQNISDVTPFTPAFADAVQTGLRGLFDHVDRYINNETVLNPNMEFISWNDYLKRYDSIDQILL